jgi:hypothetical protein
LPALAIDALPGIWSTWMQFGFDMTQRWTSLVQLWWQLPDLRAGDLPSAGAKQLTEDLAHDPLLKSIEQMWNANPLHDVIPLDWAGIAWALRTVWLRSLLMTTPRLHGRPKSVPQENTFPSLSDLGVPDRKISHRAQRIAAVPVEEFEEYLRTAHEREWEITTRLLLRHYERPQTTEINRHSVVGGRVDDLIEFARNGPKTGCIVADPSWPIRGATLPYLAMDIGDLKNLPISDLGG